MAITHKCGVTLAGVSELDVFTIREDQFSSTGNPLYSTATNPNAFANGGGDLQVFSDEACTNRLPVHVIDFVTSDTIPYVYLKVLGTGLTAGDQIWFGKDDTQTVQPAVGSTYGRNAVYASNDRRYELDGDTGSVLVDLTGNDNGTLVGSVASGSAIAPYGTASTNFNETGYYDSIVDPSAGKTQLAVSFWWNGNNTASGGVLGSYIDTTDTSFLIYVALSASTMRFRIAESGTGTEVSSTTNLFDDGLDHYVQCFYDGSNIRIIIDGTVEDTTARTGVIETPTSAPFNIGTWNDNVNERRINSKIQDLSISTSGYSLTKLDDEYNNVSNPTYINGTLHPYVAVGSTNIAILRRRREGY